MLFAERTMEVFQGAPYPSRWVRILWQESESRPGLGETCAKCGDGAVIQHTMAIRVVQTEDGYVDCLLNDPEIQRALSRFRKWFSEGPGRSYCLSCYVRRRGNWVRVRKLIAR